MTNSNLEETGIVKKIDTLTIEEVKAQVTLIQKVLREVMQKDTHYGFIPGCGDKPTLLKAGAEKLASTFRLAPDFVIHDFSTNDEIRYRIIARIVNVHGDFLGAGVGECSSNEEKYKWRKANPPEEWNDLSEDRRREKWYWGKGKQPNYRVKQVRIEISDVANTVLKMAKKRALVDAVLTITAASDIFTQDLEDMPPEEYMPPEKYKIQSKEAPVSPPQSKSAQSKSGSDVETRNKLSKILLDLSGNAPEKISDLVEEYSSFENKDGHTISRTSIENLAGKWLSSTYSKAKAAWEEAGFSEQISLVDDNEQTPEIPKTVFCPDYESEISMHRCTMCASKANCSARTDDVPKSNV